MKIIYTMRPSEQACIISSAREQAGMRALVMSEKSRIVDAVNSTINKVMADLGCRFSYMSNERAGYLRPGRGYFCARCSKKHDISPSSYLMGAHNVKTGYVSAWTCAKRDHVRATAGSCQGAMKIASPKENEKRLCWKCATFSAPEGDPSMSCAPCQNQKTGTMCEIYRLYLPDGKGFMSPTKVEAKGDVACQACQRYPVGEMCLDCRPQNLPNAVNNCLEIEAGEGIAKLPPAPVGSIRHMHETAARRWAAIKLDYRRSRR